MSTAVVSANPLVDQFADSLWLSDGLARNTIESYRRDVSQLDAWLLATQRATLAEAGASDLQAFLANRIEVARSSPRSTARLTSAMKRFYQFLLQERLIQQDPSARLESPKLTRGLPKSLSEADVEKLLDAPDLATPLGMRDKAMLETLYATGLRVTELTTLKVAQVSLEEWRDSLHSHLPGYLLQCFRRDRLFRQSRPLHRCIRVDTLHQRMNQAAHS